MVKYVKASDSNLAKLTDGVITYTGYDPSNNGKILIETKGDWTYITYQRGAFEQAIYGYINPISFFSKSDYSKYGYPSKLHKMALEGESGYVLHFYIGSKPVPDCCKKYQYFISVVNEVFVLVDSIQTGVDVCLEANPVDYTEIVYV